MSQIPETGPIVNILVSTTLFHPRQPRMRAQCVKYRNSLLRWHCGQWTWIGLKIEQKVFSSNVEITSISHHNHLSSPFIIIILLFWFYSNYFMSSLCFLTLFLFILHCWRSLRLKNWTASDCCYNCCAYDNKPSGMLNVASLSEPSDHVCFKDCPRLSVQTHPKLTSVFNIHATK